ncbi:MAG: hypothetical protein IT578_05040 [Verrucomicrobiae bacterium]|nr:hypothetical protein [Verrucomicrobiae bacterium]
MTPPRADASAGRASNVRTISGKRIAAAAPPSLPRARGGETPAPLILVAIHGILARETIVSWPDLFFGWLLKRDPTVHLDKKEYIAGPFPAWNVWAKNYWLAYGLVSELEVWTKAGNRIAIVAHSNGCDIALKAARILARRGVSIEAMVLIGGAAEPDVKKNGVFALWHTSRLKRALAYSSTGDLLTKSPLIWPWGRLGNTGWQFQGKPYGTALKPCAAAGTCEFGTRWFSPFGHCDYFHEDHREQVFERIYQDLCNACPV